MESHTLRRPTALPPTHEQRATSHAPWAMSSPVMGQWRAVAACSGKTATFPEQLSNLLHLAADATIPSNLHDRAPLTPIVLRWSALAVGVFYGFSHQRTITTTQRAEHAKHEWESKQKLIDQAKAEYAKKNNPAPAAASKNDVVTDVNDPKFDLEKLLLKVSQESP
ncbi:ATPase, F0 complex, subunit E, mitochondrial [Metarhizium guizhouense ARSEF 977]|uniref:ATP synthase F(0) complex subunit e, mitochondrial n=1 Tax=Metarhizium guizhouense (strain ARSEF 977) TaxID=1276136 RepID=A0A0B4GS57_METGA|nr:ATPase, F0 complex, subunit E, mitochondrial [Metarhizium guizhouense ARSEF 977]